MKEIEFTGSSLDDLRAFPPSARRDCGFELSKVQEGREPANWKPMSSIGSGVREIRIKEESGAYRVIYVANLKNAIYVLHCFVKKSERTPKPDIDLAKDRLQELTRRLK